jgi:hypothetical protein
LVQIIFATAFGLPRPHLRTSRWLIGAAMRGMIKDLILARAEVGLDGGELSSHRRFCVFCISRGGLTGLEDRAFGALPIFDFALGHDVVTFRQDLSFRFKSPRLNPRSSTMLARGSLRLAKQTQ